ncbi:MAG: glycosyltransferase [Hyphomicrobiaceae bacterium]|nr:glycosyltransferase [Hyphomicrobiaceae bacterium]
MRILLVSPGNNQKYGGGFFYAFHRRLINGFIRAGHFVYPYSDRDTADYALGVRAIGRRLANRRLIEIAAELKPDLVVLLLSYLIEPETVRRVREVAKGVKVAAICIDDIGHDKPAAQFRFLLQEADVGFATTGGETLARFASLRPVAFIPNPVDTSIDDQRAFAASPVETDIFFACHQPMEDPRWQRVEALRARLTGRGRRFGLHGNFATPLTGDRFVAALGRAAIGLNLNRRDGDLYASDRMAQFLGNGLLLATRRASGYDAVFSDDEMLFFDDTDDLAVGIERVLAAGEPWRAMARAGREKALRLMNETVVCRFIVDFAMAGRAPSDWAFTKHMVDRRA